MLEKYDELRSIWIVGPSSVVPELPLYLELNEFVVLCSLLDARENETLE